MKITAVLILLLPCLTLSLINFPHIIWVYWETDFQKAPLITRVSYEKMVISAQEANWTVNLINGNNIHQYLTDINGFNNAVKYGKRQTVQEKSDILRIWLIQQHGGVWIDFVCIPYENFDWLRNYSSYQHMLINRRGSNLDDPDMLMFGEGWHQSPLSFYNSEGNLVTDEYFGMAIHFIAAKKKTEIMADWKQQFKRVSRMSYEEMIPEWKQHRFYIHNIDRSDAYYSGNIALEQTIQQKQFQIDKNLTLFSIRLNVYEYYKIWSIHGEVGPIGLTRKDVFKPSDLFVFTSKEVEQRAGQQRFYLKINHVFRVTLQDSIKRTREYLQKYNKTITSILKNGPTQQQCQILFIVQGSILHHFFKDSKYINELRVPFITVQQRDTLRQMCIFDNEDVYGPTYPFNSVGNYVSPQREIYAKETSLKTQLWVWWFTGTTSINQWLNNFIGPALFFAFYGVLKLLFGYFLKRPASNSNQQPHSNSGDQCSSTFSNRINSELEHNKGQSAKSSHIKLMTILIILFISVLYASFEKLFECIQIHGELPMYNYIAVMALMMVSINEFTKKQINHNQINDKKTTWLTRLQTINRISRMFLFMYSGHCILMHFHIMPLYAYRDVLLMVGMGYLLYVIYSEMQERKFASNKFHDFIVYLMGRICPFLIMGFLCLVVVWRNPMYLTYGDHYLKLIFINGLKNFFNVFSKFSIGYFLVILARNIIFFYRPQQSFFIPQQSVNMISKRLLLKESIIFFLSTIYWIITYIRIEDKYNNIDKNMEWFNHMTFMKYFILQFGVFELGMRIKLPQSFGLKYYFAIHFISFIHIILFCILGFDLFAYLFIDNDYVNANFIILIFILSLLSLLKEIFTNQQTTSVAQQYKTYEQLNEINDIPMSDVKIQNENCNKK